MSVQDLKKLYERVTTWQRKTFPNQTAASILAHMWKELAEIAAAPHDVEERADMAILAMGYADRAGLSMSSQLLEDWTSYSWGFDSTAEAIRALSFDLSDVQVRKTHLRLAQILARCTMGTGLSYQQFLSAISAKMDKNEARRWPSPSEQVPGQPVEHVREPSGGAAPCGTLTILAPSSSALVSLVEPVSGVVLRLPDVVTVRDLITQWRERGVELERIRESVNAEVWKAQQEARAAAAERAEWRANNDRLREERQRVREILDARPNEGVIEAARRVMVRPVDTNPGAALAPGEEAPQ